jgi:ABC-type sugar transport system substrate-binding protein
VLAAAATVSLLLTLSGIRGDGRDRAVAALREVSAELGQPELARLPVVGCDGTPEGGQALVRGGELAGTVVLPVTSGPAVELLHAATRGRRPSAVVRLKGSPFPEEIGPVDSGVKGWLDPEGRRLAG